MYRGDDETLTIAAVNSLADAQEITFSVRRRLRDDSPLQVQKTMTAGDIVLGPGAPAPAPGPGGLTPEQFERQYYEAALRQAHWVAGGPNGAAAFLKMPESTLRLRMQRLPVEEKIAIPT